MNRMIDGSEASWVWPATLKTGVNQYVEFRQEFELNAPPSQTQLLVSVDSNYAVWINGQFINCGQYHDFPAHKVYDTLPLENILMPGKNDLQLLVHYQGENSMQYIKGEPGLLYVLSTGDAQEIVSGRNTFYRVSPCYHQGPYAKITNQLSFSFEYDARGEIGEPAWTPAGESDLTTQTVRPLAEARPIEKVEIKNRLAGKIIAQGIFKRENSTGSAGQTVAKLMQTDFLSPRETKDIFKTSFCESFGSEGVRLNESLFGEGRGIYLLIDLGREEAGFFDMELDAAAGTIVDIGYGEHLDWLRVHTKISERNFAARYICKNGRQSFTHRFKRFAGRYIQLHITSSAEVTLYYAGLLPTEYPIVKRGSFESPDSLQNKIYNVSIRTLHLCMHEHYEDCPWREQALYANDSRNQALCGYYCFGEYKFPAASFDLLGRSLKDDGYLEICSPAEWEITIPSFSLAWILELGDYYLFSGDRPFIQRMLPRVQKMVSIYLSSLIDNLLPSPKGKRYWHFYDWADGLNGCDPAGFVDLEKTRFDAPLNLFFVQVLEAASRLALACDLTADAESYLATAQTMKQAIHAAFWDSAENAYVTYLGEGQTQKHFSELVQSLAISTKVCPAIPADMLRERLTRDDNGLVQTTLSQSIYKFQAILENKKEFGKQVFDKIARDWGYMLFHGATSFWETLRGGADFDHAGSLCHGWSAVPIYFYQAYLLGIKPTSPGFKTFSVDPVKTVIDKSSGIVPTPFGPIQLEWQLGEHGITYCLTHPASIRPEVLNLENNDKIIVKEW